MLYTTDGHDLIFATGAPGSKWSRILTVLSNHSKINSSDRDKFPTWAIERNLTDGEDKELGLHSGVYFGPDNGYGENFDNLDALTKEEFLNEISKPFDNFEEGIKVIKSHWFSYNLDWITRNFPKAKIILCYNGYQEAFKWWHLVGGWNIKFPIYTWYKDNERMYRQLSKENDLLIEFSIKHKLQFGELATFEELLTSLGLAYENFLENNKEAVDPLLNKNNHRNAISPVICVYNPDINVNSLKLTRMPDKFAGPCPRRLKERHNRQNVDSALIKIYGKEWFDDLEKLMSKIDLERKEMINNSNI